MSSSSSSHVDLHKPGGGKNPLPFSSGGGFSGMSSANFRRYWVRRAAARARAARRQSR